MENTTDQIIEELEKLQAQIIQYEKQLLIEVLNIQQVFNKLQSTSMVKPKQIISQKQTPKIEKPSMEDKQFKNNIGEMFAELADFDVLNIQKNKKQLPITNKFPPIVQKKPPIPTVNRTNDPIKTKITPMTKFVPPRNKNQVTGKVTQNKIITQQKVFKPQVTKSTTKNQPSNKSIQKRSSNSVSTSNKSITQQLESNKESIAEYKQVRCKLPKVELKTFLKSQEELLEEIRQNKSKKKYNMQPFIEKILQGEMGYKNQQKKKRQGFIKHYSNMCASRRFTHDITHSIPKRSWKQYPHIFNFNDLIETFNQKLQKLIEYKKQDLRIDQKQVYRLHYMKNLLQKQLQQIRQSVCSQVPQKIELTFQVIVRSESQNKEQNDSLLQFDKGVFFQKLRQLLNQIKTEQNLQTKELSQLRILTQISKYQGKRSPLIIQPQQYQKWQQFYQQN